MRKAIDCANSIEQLLASNQDIFLEFLNAIRLSKIITVYIFIKAISKLHPMTESILPKYLQRSS